MEFLEIPELLKGEWENLLIMTYGADIAFFENSLWRQFSPRCRNKIILADSAQYLKAFQQSADNGTARLLNHRYLLDGIYIPQSAHAKFILLTNHEKGRLLVGSGNLGIDGYASGGELFTHYEYSNNTPDNLSAFLSVWEFVQDLISHGYVSDLVNPYIQHILTETPWLLKSCKGEFVPLINNLKTSLLSQIKEIIGNETIQELWIMSPFYDEKAEALRQLAQSFSPNEITILIQKDRTSVDPDAIAKVISQTESKCKIKSIEIRGDSSNTYVHAKLYLFKTKDKSICIQGSPNLSQVAMLFTPPSGNIELANVRIGGRNEFDSIFENLIISTDDLSIDDLNISFNKADEDLLTMNDWHLVRGLWRDNHLVLSFTGKLPKVSTARIQIGDSIFSARFIKAQDDYLECLLPEEAKPLLSSPAPLAIYINDEATPSNPIFVWNQIGLNREMLEASESEAEVGKFGGLDVEDEELERLLGELEAALVIDGQSIWQLAGKQKTPPSADTGEELIIDYSDVDYEQLRRHPKYIQYTHGLHGEGLPFAPKTKLQMILGSITDHFNGLVEPVHPIDGVPVYKPPIEDATSPETEEEQEQEEAEKQKKRKSANARLKRILKSFIKRYINGIQSRKFQELAGFNVMARNYVIFTHLLWQLLTKEWVELDYIVASFNKIWVLFWGCKNVDGYYSSLDPKEREETIKVIKEHHSDGLQMAALFYGAYFSVSQEWEGLRFSLRDFLRYFMENPPFEIDQQVLIDAWTLTSHLLPYSPPTPSRIVDELIRLSNFESKKGFLRSVELEFDYAEGACTLEKLNVYREHLGDSAPVECLVINNPNAVTKIDEVFNILNLWRRYRTLDYYRISSGDNKRLFYYDFIVNRGLFYNKETDHSENIDKLPASTGGGWDNQLNQVKNNALRVDETITLPKAALAQGKVISSS